MDGTARTNCEVASCSACVEKGCKSKLTKWRPAGACAEEQEDVKGQ